MSEKQVERSAATHCYPQDTVACIVGYERYLIRHPEAVAQGKCVELPFQCDHCHKSRYALEMIGGDGDLICTTCFESYVSALDG